MALIKKAEHPAVASTPARVIGGMVSAAFLAASVSMMPAAIRALIASGGDLAHLTARGWPPVVESLAYLALAALSARRAWLGKWPDDYGLDDLPDAGPQDYHALSERIGISAAELDARAAELDDDDADDEKLDEHSST